MKILIIGAGNIGKTIYKFLDVQHYDVTIADLYKPTDYDYNYVKLDASDKAQLKEVMKDCDIVVSALSYRFNRKIAKIALKVGASYFDLTEDVDTTEYIKKLAANAKDNQIFMPQCGLAPGVINILAYDLCTKFEVIHDVKLRVGSLPKNPNNRLKYNRLWSTDGLINEYCNPCDAIVDTKKTKVKPMEGLETITIDGEEYEAFNTSGGLASMMDTLENAVLNLDYKTMRYPGHNHLMRFLLEDMNYRNNKDELIRMFDTEVPYTLDDVVILYASVTGYVGNSNLTEYTKVIKVENMEWFNVRLGAIQTTTASGLCGVLELHLTGSLPSKGFVKQEDVKLSDFMDTSFGRYYKES